MAKNVETYVGQHLAPENQSLGTLMAQLSEQTSHLTRDELRLARLEIIEKSTKASRGAGLIGGAGLLVLYGVACGVAAAILVLSGPLTPWAAALIVGTALLAVAAVGALLGRHEVKRATPPMPTEAIGGVKHDLAALKGRTKE